jgi:hypothetical protein
MKGAWGRPPGAGFGAVSTTPTPVQQQIIDAANSAGVPPSLALAVAQQESGFQQTARGAAGEVGIFQIMPTTAPGANLTDPSVNIDTGVGLLAKYYQQYGGDLASILTAYNAGPGAVGNPPSSTKNYIASVANLQSQYSVLDTGGVGPVDTTSFDITGQPTDTPSGDGSIPTTSGIDLSSITGFASDNPGLLIAAAAAFGLFVWAATR